MARTYTLNTESAKSVGQSSYINESGRYTGTFTLAKAVVSTKGTEGVEFAFKSDADQTADYLTLWTYNDKGEELFGGRMLHALMTCMKVRELQAAPRNVKNRQGQTEAVDAFPALMGPRVGLLLQREATCKKDGSEGFRMNIYAPFEAATGLTAHEILEKKVRPEQLDKLLANLKDKPMSDAERKRQQKILGGGDPYAYDSPRAAAVAGGGGGVADMDDDIPF